MESKHCSKLIRNRPVVLQQTVLVCGTITTWLKYNINEHLVNQQSSCFCLLVMNSPFNAPSGTMFLLIFAALRKKIPINVHVFGDIYHILTDYWSYFPQF